MTAVKNVTTTSVFDSYINIIIPSRYNLAARKVTWVVRDRYPVIIPTAAKSYWGKDDDVSYRLHERERL